MNKKDEKALVSLLKDMQATISELNEKISELKDESGREYLKIDSQGHKIYPADKGQQKIGIKLAYADGSPYFEESEIIIYNELKANTDMSEDDLRAEAIETSKYNRQRNARYRRAMDNKNPSATEEDIALSLEANKLLNKIITIANYITELSKNGGDKSNKAKIYKLNAEANIYRKKHRYIRDLEYALNETPKEYMEFYKENVRSVLRGEDFNVRKYVDTVRSFKKNPHFDFEDEYLKNPSFADDPQFVEIRNILKELREG